MYLMILFFPLIGFLLAGLFGRFFGRRNASTLGVLCIGISAIISIFIFYEIVLCYSVVNLILYDWMYVGPIKIEFGLFYDSLTSIMLIIITWISYLVHLYSRGYMSHDPHMPRFISYLSLFTFFMLFLVTADNYVQMFFGWEGVGLCSYLLINFWFSRILANKAALKAMIMNRVADVFFILAILLILLKFKTANYLIVLDLVVFIKDDYLIFCGYYLNLVFLISFFLFIGAVGKSAQIGLHTWLPDAMEGPTPVSALLHAATMVTAGIFLLLRCSIWFEYAEDILILVALIGGLTSVLTALASVFQYDVKKVIAYSTCSQLGYMFLSCGLSIYEIALFHLLNHAFFKALLFLGAGSIIHSLLDEQDMRKMGGLIKILPFTYFCMLLGSMAIIGFPFLAGFYSKDLILELVYTRIIVDGLFIYSIAICTAFFTAVYSIRLLIFVFFKKSAGYKILNLHSRESDKRMRFSMLFLAVATIFIGYLFSEISYGSGSFFQNTALQVVPNHFSDVEFLLISPFLKNLPFLFSFTGVFIGIFFSYVSLVAKHNYRFFFFKHLLILKKTAFFFFSQLVLMLFTIGYLHCF